MKLSQLVEILLSQTKTAEGTHVIQQGLNADKIEIFSRQVTDGLKKIPEKCILTELRRWRKTTAEEAEAAKIRLTREENLKKETKEKRAARKANRERARKVVRKKATKKNVKA